MSDERKKELVFTILSEVQDQAIWDLSHIKVQADFIRIQKNESNGAMGKFDFKDVIILLLIFRSAPLNIYI